MTYKTTESKKTTSPLTSFRSNFYFYRLRSQKRHCNSACRRTKFLFFFYYSTVRLANKKCIPWVPTECKMNILHIDSSVARQIYSPNICTKNSRILRKSHSICEVKVNKWYYNKTNLSHLSHIQLHNNKEWDNIM